MKTSTASVAFVTLVLSLTGCCSNPQPPTTVIPQQIAIESVISQVQQSLATVQTALVDNELPPLKQVKLTLQTVASKKGGGTLKLWVISVGGSIEKERTQQIEMVLTPPPPGGKAAMSSESLTKNLEDAIMSAAKGAKNAPNAAVPLKLTGLDVEIGFTVKAAGEGGASIEIAPVTLELTGEVAKTSVQTITVSFATKE